MTVQPYWDKRAIMTESKLYIVQIYLLAIGMLKSCPVNEVVSEAIRKVVLELRVTTRKTTIIKVRTTHE
jgi:hypothetical protein